MEEVRMSAGFSCAVIGAGNAGQIVAADLVRQGYQDVALVESNPDTVQSIRASGGIAVVGEVAEWFAPIRRIGLSLAEAVRTSEVLFVATNATGYPGLMRDLAPLLRDEHILVALTGYYASLALRQALRTQGCTAQPTVVEMMTLPFASRLVGPAEVGLRCITERLPTAVWPKRRTDAVLRPLRNIYPMLVEAQNVLEVSLNNPNPVFHVAVALLNLGRFESGEVAKGIFYGQWASPGIERVWQLVDDERMAVMRALGLSPISKDEYREVVYGSRPMKPVVTRGAIPPSSYSLPPRFFDEDVPYGLCPVSAFGQIAGSSTRTIDLLIDLASVVKDREYRATGFNLAQLGIDGLSPDAVVRVAEGLL
jgi:opine dehydrogenase